MVRKNRLISMFLGFVLLLDQSACLKRVAIPLEQEELTEVEVMYVLLHSGIEYKVEKPRLENQHLIGIIGGKQTTIPLDDIRRVEVVKPDKKKMIRGAIIGAALFVTFGIIMSIYSPIHIGSVE